MHHALDLVVSGGLAALVVVLFTAVLLFRGRSGRAVVTQAPTPRSLISLLTTEEELSEAARRAASFERSAADRASARAAQYEALAEPETGLEPEATLHDLGQRSAS